MKTVHTLLLLLAAVILGCRESGEPTAPGGSSKLTISGAAGGSRVITLSPSEALNSTEASPFSMGPVTSPFGQGNFVSQVLTVSNIGTRTTSAVSVSLLEAPFVITDDACTGRSLGVAGSKKSSCTLTVTFHPTSIGTFATTLTISIAQPKTTLTVYVSGTAQDPGYTISGLVFIDQNGDGVWQAVGDIGAEGYEVALKDQSGTTTLRTTTSGSDGTYSFVGVDIGSYQVTVTLVQGDVATTPLSRSVTVPPGVENLRFGFLRVAQP